MVAYSLISYLNIRYRIRFCDACGKMLVNYSGLERPKECSKCGATLREPNGRAEQIVGREPRERVSHEAFVNQSWRYRAAASTPPLGG
jgi:ribosomal protein S27E